MTTPLTLVGNLTTAPELRTTATGRSVTRARLACNDTWRKPDGTLAHRDTLYYDVQLWGDLADRFATLPKGAAVVVHGELRASTYETEDGQKRTRQYLHAIAGGPDLARMEVSGVQRPARGDAAQDQPASPAGEDAGDFDIDALLG